MSRIQVTWDEFPSSITVVGRWKAGILFEPAGGEARGGDRFSLNSTPTGALAFYVADATGHGRKGARFWEGLENPFRDSWQRFAQEPDEPTLIRFAAEVNDAVHGRQVAGDTASSSQLCLTAGWISSRGEVVMATFGLGVYAGAMTTSEPWGLRPQELGFRLGWVPSPEWARFKADTPIQRISDVQRLWLASDAFFGEDHFDPEGAFERARELGRAVAGLTIPDALSYVRALPHTHDDATFVVFEPVGPGGSSARDELHERQVTAGPQKSLPAPRDGAGFAAPPLPPRLRSSSSTP